jgi:hypothetical protein
MITKHQDCADCGSNRTIVLDDDTLGFEYDLYRKRLACGEIEDVDSSEIVEA